MEKEITIQSLAMEVLKRWWIVCICVVLCGAIFFVYSNNFIKDKFKSTGSVYVDNKAQEIISQETKNNTANLYDLTTAEMLVDTYIEILRSKGFFDIVDKKSDVPYSANQIGNMVSYRRVEETGIIYIDVSAPDPVYAQKICQAVIDCANIHIMNIVEAGSVKTVDKASLPKSRFYPNVTKTTLLGMIIGFVFACLLIFAINYFDVHIKTAEDIEFKYDLTVLGIIPNMAVDNNASNGGAYGE